MASANLWARVSGVWFQMNPVGGSRVSCVLTHDGNTSYMDRSPSQGGQESYYCTAMPVASAVATLGVASWTATTNAGQGRHKQIYSGSYNTGGYWNYAYTYTSHSGAWGTKPGGGAWSQAIVDATQMDAENRGNGGAGSARWTQIYMYVSYTPGGAQNLVKFARALIGSALTSAEWYKLVNLCRFSEVKEWSNIIYDLSDLEALKAEFRNSRRAYAY